MMSVRSRFRVFAKLYSRLEMSQVLVISLDLYSKDEVSDVSQAGEYRKPLILALYIASFCLEQLLCKL